MKEYPHPFDQKIYEVDRAVSVGKRRLLAGLLISGLLLAGSTSNQPVQTTAKIDRPRVATKVAAPAVVSSFNDHELSIADPSVVGMSPRDLNYHFNLIDSTGAAGIRFDLSWHAIKPTADAAYQWDKFDPVAIAAKEHGKKILGILGSAPDWAISKCFTEAQCLKIDLPAFIQYATDTVQHYSALGIHDYELWNEPNMSEAWDTKPDAVDYANLVRLTCPVIKQIDPLAYVVTGGLGLGDRYGDIPLLSYEEQFLAANPGNCFDAFGVHLYGSTSDQLPEIQQLLEKYNFGDKPVWATEVGFHTFGACGKYGNASNALQAQELAQVVGEWRSYNWTGPMFWFITEDIPKNNITFGLYCAGGIPKPSLNVFQELAKQG